MENEKFEEVILAKIQKAIGEASKSAVDKADYDTKMDEIATQVSDLKEASGVKDSIIEKLELAMKNQGLEMEKLKLKTGPQKLKSFEDAVRDALNEKKDAFERSFKTKNGSFEFDIDTKEVADMSTANVTGGTLFQTISEPVREGAPSRNPFILNMIQVGTTANGKISWVERQVGEGGSGMTAEGAKFNQKDLDWVEKSTEVKKITVYTKVTNEMLEDMDALISEIRTELLEDMNLTLDAQLLTGDGSTATNLSGILDDDTGLLHATVWSNVLGSYVDSPQEYDVLKVAVTQVLEKHFRPNYIVLNPVDAAKMELIKDSTGQYIIPPFVTQGGVKVAGIPVVENTGMTAGTFLVGDFKKAKAFFQRKLTFNIYDQNEDDALKDRRTMTGTARLAFRIKDIHKEAFVYGTFSTAITTLTAV